jgi:16S rRNA (cytidine1402-2'-O)-methyltransferase
MDGVMMGTLFLIPCPITEGGSMDVIPTETSSIALRSRIFLVENVKQARRYLKSLDPSVDINRIQFHSMGKHAEAEELSSIITHLKSGQDVGMISDAGCPAVADPGWEMVDLAHKNGIHVRPLVGPSSILLTLMASGMNGQAFSFHGYLPIDKSDRQQSIKDMVRSIERNGATQLFMDTPFRNEKLFKDILSNSPDNLRLCLAQDVTGAKELIITKSIKDWKSKSPDFQKIPMMMALGH